MNKISQEDRLMNLYVLLRGISYTTNVELPSNSDTDKVLNAHSTPAVNTEDVEILIEANKHYVTLVKEEGVNNWDIATCTEIMKMLAHIGWIICTASTNTLI